MIKVWYFPRNEWGRGSIQAGAYHNPGTAEDFKDLEQSWGPQYVEKSHELKVVKENGWIGLGWENRDTVMYVFEINKENFLQYLTSKHKFFVEYALEWEGKL